MNEPTKYFNRPPPSCPLDVALFEALGADLAAAGIHASPEALLRHVVRRSCKYVLRPLPPLSVEGREHEPL
jgi:hypothetical protein